MPPPGFYPLKLKEQASSNGAGYLELDPTSGPLTASQLRELADNDHIVLHRHLNMYDPFNGAVKRAQTRKDHILPLEPKYRAGRILKSFIIPPANHEGRVAEEFLIEVLPREIQRPTFTTGRKRGERNGEGKSVQMHEFLTLPQKNRAKIKHR